MEQNLSIHQVLLKRSKAKPWPYMSSILMVNKDVPMFEAWYGQLDYDWLLHATRDRKCCEVQPSVIRWVDGSNLSLDPDYRRRDFYMGLLAIDGDLDTMKRWYSSRARYHYLTGEVKLSRFFFLRGHINWKTILYFITSYSNSLRRIIIRKFGVFG